MFIEIEGIDGAGKTTQCELLKKYFEDLGLEAVLVNDLRSTVLGQSVRAILSGAVPPDPTAEMFLFLACKAESFARIIAPGLAAGKVVITDRGIVSFLSYSNTRTGLSEAELLDLLRAATLNVEPDITFLLDLPPATAIARNIRRGSSSKFDLDKSYLSEQREKMSRLSHVRRNWSVIDAARTTDEVHSAIVGIIAKIGGGQNS